MRDRRAMEQKRQRLPMMKPRARLVDTFSHTILAKHFTVPLPQQDVNLNGLADDEGEGGHRRFPQHPAI